MLSLADWSVGIIPEAVRAVTPGPEKAQLLSGRFADSPFTAPGWREITTEYSCVPDAAYPWDPQIVREIRKCAPDVVPMWVRWVFLSPRGEGTPFIKVFGRHAIGRHVPNLFDAASEFRCLMPTGKSFPRPNRIWFIHQGAMTRDRNASLPGDYLPFDSDLLMKIQDASTVFNMTEKEFKDSEKARIVEAKRRAMEIFRKQWQADMDDRERDFNAYAEKQMEKISDVEIKEYTRAAGHRERKRRPMVIVP